MFCTNCGKEIEPDDHFCPSCGHPREEEEAAKTDTEPGEVEEAPEPAPEEKPQAEESGAASEAESTQPHTPPEMPHGPPEIPTGPAPAGKKKISGCGLAAIIGGSVFLILLVVLALVMGVVLSATSGVSGALDDTLDLIRAGEVDAAYESTTGNFKEVTSLEMFRNYLQTYPVISQSEKAKYSEKEIENGIATLKGNLISPDGSRTPFVAQMVKEGDDWRLQIIELPDAPPGGGQSTPDDFLNSEKPASTASKPDYVLAFEAHLDLLRNDDFETAYTKTSQDFRNSTDVQGYRQFVAAHSFLLSAREIIYDKTEQQGDIGMMRGVLVDDAAGRQRFIVQMNREGSGWILHGLQLPGPDDGQASQDAPGGFDYAIRSVPHPEFNFTYQIPDGWQERSNDGKFAITPPEGDPMDGKAWMSVTVEPNTAKNSEEEVRELVTRATSGMASFKAGDSFTALLNNNGEPVGSHGELPPGEPGQGAAMLEFTFTQDGEPWKGRMMAVAQEDDKGDYHYVFTARAKESAWLEAEPVFDRFVELKFN